MRVSYQYADDCGAIKKASHTAGQPGEPEKAVCVTRIRFCCTLFDLFSDYVEQERESILVCFVGDLQPLAQAKQIKESLNNDVLTASYAFDLPSAFECQQQEDLYQVSAFEILIFSVEHL